MSDLFDKSIRTLELPRVLELLAGCAVTEEGKERARALRPMTDLDDVERAQKETTAAVKMLILRGSPGFSGVRPVAASLQRADRGGSLSTRELLDIASVLRCARSAAEYGAGAEKTPISHLFQALTPLRSLEESISTSILGEEEIADSASPELASIRRHMRATESKVRDILQRLISSNQSKYLQESIITIRSDRYVVPVKSEHKNAIPGLVHDVSSSGSTFFIEPMGVVKANNERRELAAKEKKEIERILAELSAACAARKEDIGEDYRLLVWLDEIFARGQLSLKLGCTEPALSDKLLRLRGARHPLLDRKKAVANDLELGERFDTLVITGPNTGGKTVTMKTVGLITLMAQCGLHIPAKDDSTVRVYRRVLADIGDEQSIAQSLSTFSSHMTNIVGILGEADGDTLILFDELCAGTDPVEGAALAAACLTAGIDGGEINRVLFETKSRPRFEMERIVFDTMEFHENGAIAVAVLWRRDIDHVGADMDDLDSIASLTRQIEGVQIGITLTEKPDGTVRVSVRTTKEMDAAAICKKVGGGGHVRAAGASFTCGMAEAKAAMLKAAEEQFHAAK